MVPHELLELRQRQAVRETAKALVLAATATLGTERFPVDAVAHGYAPAKEFLTRKGSFARSARAAAALQLVFPYRSGLKHFIIHSPVGARKVLSSTRGAIAKRLGVAMTENL